MISTVLFVQYSALQEQTLEEFEQLRHHPRVLRFARLVVLRALTLGPRRVLIRLRIYSHHTEYEFNKSMYR